MFYPLLDPRNFLEFTLTTSDFVCLSLLSCAALGVTAWVSVRSMSAEPRRLSFALSLLNSSLLTVVGVLYLAVRLPTFNNIFAWADNSVAFFEGRDNVAVAAAFCFDHYLLFDLIVGTLYYPKYMDFWSAYFHHVFYFVFSIIGTTTNGVLFTLPGPISPCFVVCCIEELPTMIMALGTVFPQLRSDAAFGASFLILRIGYHIFLMCYAIKLGCQPFVLFLFVSTTGLHLMWAWIWITKYGLKMVFGDKKKAIKSTSSPKAD